MNAVLCIAYLGHYVHHINMSSLLIFSLIVWVLRPTLLLSGLSVLFVFPLDLFKSLFLLLCFIEILVFKGLHVGAELAVRG